MKTSASFLTLTIFTILLLATPVNMMPLHNGSSNSSNATASSPGQHFSLSGFTTMVSRLVGAMQTIWSILANHGRIAPFEYCFIVNILNISNTGLAIEGRLFIDYQVLYEITVPLRDVVSYEANINNDSDMYQKLSYAEKQINKSLEYMGLSAARLVQPNTPEVITSNNSTINSTLLQGRCVDGVTNSIDEFRDLLEIYLGLNFAVWDLINIQRELDPHYPHGNNS